MTLPFDAMFPPFEVYSVKEPARRVAADLRARGVTRALFQLDETPAGRWELLTVDEDLFAALEHRRRRWFQSGPTVEKAIEDLLRKLRDQDQFKRVAILNITNVGDLFHTSARFENPAGACLFRGSDGVIRGLGMGNLVELPQERIIVYPKLACAAGTQVAPDQIVEFSVEIDLHPPVGTAARLEVVFPENAHTLNMSATVSSADFARAGDSDWSTTFTLRRRTTANPDVTFTCDPSSWTFRAQALGDRSRYSLTVLFLAAGQVIGALEATLVRRGLGLTPKQDETPLMLPVRSGPQCALVVSSDSNQHYTFWCYRSGVLECKAPAAFDYEQYFTQLDLAETRENLENVTQGLTNDVPITVLRFIGAAQDEGQPLLIASVGRVAPFEIARTRPTDARSLLGVVRPVLRWIDAPMPDVTRLKIGPLAAIRPAYAVKADQLPQAEAEETYLCVRFPERVGHFATKSDIDRLLDRTDVRLLHFAGHANGSPAELSLEDRRIPPTAFDASKACVLRKPFFFVNGCRTGASVETAPSMLGNFVRSLLRQGFCGAVAPSIRVKSDAALEAAQLFYAADATGTVGELVQKIRGRALADGVADALRASYLSYVAFAPADLRLEF
jgi:hypothetical protein